MPWVRARHAANVVADASTAAAREEEVSVDEAVERTQLAPDTAAFLLALAAAEGGAATPAARLLARVRLLAPPSAADAADATAAATAAYEPHPKLAPLRRLLAAARESAAAATPGAMSAEAAALGEVYRRAATDGELLEEGVEQLLRLLQPGPGAVFCDLGSGRGEALLHVAARGRYRGCIGVELLEERHSTAVGSLAAAVGDGLLPSPVRLVRGDLTELGAWVERERAEADGAEAPRRWSGEARVGRDS